jgi:hypothetical protein
VKPDEGFSYRFQRQIVWTRNGMKGRVVTKNLNYIAI